MIRRFVVSFACSEGVKLYVLYMCEVSLCPVAVVSMLTLVNIW